MKYVVTSNPQYYPSVEYFDTLEAAEEEFNWLLECYADLNQPEVTVSLCEVKYIREGVEK